MKYPIQKQIPNKLRQFRHELGLTQAELASALGVTRITVARWETGIRIPSFLMLNKIAEVLGCNIVELLV